MKKITITLLSLITCASFAQTSVIDFESGSGDDFGVVDNDFSFGRVVPVTNNRFLDPPYDANPDPTGNTTARCRELNVVAAEDPGFGAYRIIFRPEAEFNVLLNPFITVYMRAPQAVDVNVQMSDADPNEAPFSSTNLSYSGSGSWELVEGAITNDGGDDIYSVLQFNIPQTTTDYSLFIDEIEVSDVSLSTGDFANSEVSVYPIPATLAVNIRGDISGNTASIYDITGSLVSTSAITGDFNSVDVSALSKGVYFLQLENGSVLKFVK